VVDNTSVNSRFMRGVEGLEETIAYSSSRLIISGISTVGRVYPFNSYIVVGYRGLISYSSS